MTTLDPVDPETWARRILDRPDQVHPADPEKLRGLLDEIRGLRARIGEGHVPASMLRAVDFYDGPEGPLIEVAFVAVTDEDGDDW